MDSANPSALILVLDEGTTSTRAFAFGQDGSIVAGATRAVPSHRPHDGWVEQDAAEIWALSLECLRGVVAEVGVASIAAIGLTNQRETVVAWDKATGEPLAPAIVWQDRRTAARCAEMRAAGFEPAAQATTGLLLDPYFSATKFDWLLGNHAEIRAAAREGRLALGTIDAWLLWKLTGGRVHATDATNASRTLLMDLKACSWHAGMIERFRMPVGALPVITDCAGPLGTTTLFGRPLPITASIGDQQAAAIGQGCLARGSVKATFGTGIFALAHGGPKRLRSKHRLLATLAWRLNGVPAFALEGSVFTGGAAVQWLRDGLGLIDDAAATATLAASVPDSGGVVMVPAFGGMGAPHWRDDVRGLLTGLTATTTRAHVVRATLAAMAHQTADLLAALAADGIATGRLRVDGGMVANDWLCQHLADVLGVPVERPRVIETTALGCAMLAGLGAGLFATLGEAAAMAGAERVFTPAIDDAARGAARDAWAHAVRQALAA